MSGNVNQWRQLVKDAATTQYPALLLLGRSDGRLLAAKRLLPTVAYDHGGTVS